MVDDAILQYFEMIVSAMGCADAASSSDCKLSVDKASDEPPVAPKGVQVPVEGNVFTDYRAGNTTVTHRLTHEPRTVEGKWSLVCSADGTVGQLERCVEGMAEPELLSLDEVLTQLVVTKEGVPDLFVV